jgi:hypothetical protein
MRFAPAIPFVLLTSTCFAQIVTGSMSSYAGPGWQTNNPVSMVFEHKQSQTLADGTHIVTVTHEYFYRDSLGRTRNEFETPVQWTTDGTAIHTVNVNDVVARTFTSWRTGVPGETLHQFNRVDETPRPSVQAGLPATESGDRIQLTAKVLPAPPVARLRPKRTTEQIGTQDLQGIPCEATRTTEVYPVDLMGNDRPITTVTERCLSREFGRVLRDSTEDPRSGTRTTTLQSVSRGEPDPSLFQPPSDYMDAKSGAR